MFCAIVRVSRKSLDFETRKLTEKQKNNEIRKMT